MLITYSHYRTTTLMQSYSPFKADKFIATAGNQNISFSFSDQLSQRIDRFHHLSGAEPKDVVCVCANGVKMSGPGHPRH
jgi:hypothetical protein